jgi:hypothetical protein|eukprot:scaffold12180_cov267-Chaetoceros_neogracile.AAC.5
MVATNDTEKGSATANLITKYTYYLSTMPIISTLAGVTSSMFAIEGLFLNGYAIYVAKKFEKERSNGSARKVFLTSLWYLPCWMILFLLHSKKWRDGVDGEDSIDEDLIETLKRKVDSIRQGGREICPHEIFVFGTDDKGHLNANAPEPIDGVEKKCPVLLRKKTVENASNISSKNLSEHSEEGDL